MPIHWNMNHVLQNGVKSLDLKAVYTEQASILTDTSVHFSFCPPQLLFSYNHTYNRSCSCVHKTPLVLLGVIHSTHLYARKQSLHENLFLCLTSPQNEPCTVKKDVSSVWKTLMMSFVTGNAVTLSYYTTVCIAM